MHKFSIVIALASVTAFSFNNAIAAGVAGEIEEVMVSANTMDDELSGKTEAASVGTVLAEQIEHRPVLRPAEILETIPGMVITQHSGGGKANQYFLRGFNLDHSTDFASYIEGAPVNNVTHGHGQGYTDLNFLVPELLDKLVYKKGPYYASSGDFSSAGSAQLFYANQKDSNKITLTLAEDNYQRLLFVGGTAVGAEGNLVYGIENLHDDGQVQKHTSREELHDGGQARGRKPRPHNAIPEGTSKVAIEPELESESDVVSVHSTDDEAEIADVRERPEVDLDDLHNKLFPEEACSEPSSEPISSSVPLPASSISSSEPSILTSSVPLLRSHKPGPTPSMYTAAKKTKKRPAEADDPEADDPGPKEHQRKKKKGKKLAKLAHKAAKPAAKKKKKKKAERSAYEGDSKTHYSEKASRVAESYKKTIDLTKVAMKAAINRVYSAGYHAELKRRKKQRVDEEKAKTDARAFGRQCRDLWLTMVDKKK